ncbi:ATP-binding protein [Mesorhizobium sp. M0904]|uniref:ATP-binding protein n=1 Tax=Mesorhizobium sp. M0904 TaxID=2957022 RepID=UPI00333A0D02
MIFMICLPSRLAHHRFPQQGLDQREGAFPDFAWKTRWRSLLGKQVWLVGSALPALHGRLLAGVSRSAENVDMHRPRGAGRAGMKGENGAPREPPSSGRSLPSSRSESAPGCHPVVARHRPAHRNNADGLLRKSPRPNVDERRNGQSSLPRHPDNGHYEPSPTGTGKTWLACALGRQAARLDHSVLYLRMPRLFEDLALARLDGRFPRLIDKLARVQLLILDDWGTHSLTDQQRLDLLEIFEERYRRKSTLITAQLPIAQWHAMIGEPTIADAILDRIVHNAHRVTLEGDSMRKQKTPPLLTGAENGEINRK